MARAGRGTGYTKARGLVEAVLSRAYAFDWPARLLPPLGEVVPRRHGLLAPGLPAGFGPLRVGFASDLHAGPTTPRARLEQAFEALRSFQPHLLLLGGDYVLFDAAHVERLVPLIESVPAPLGRFAVLGNHDLWADDRRIAAALGRAGAKVLINEVAVPSEAPFLSVGGLDDGWAGRPHYPRAFAGASAVHLLLMHGPDHVPMLAPHRFDAALCGHTHGGHVALPGGRPLHMPSALCRRYRAGRYRLDGGPLFVSRGVGNVEVPFRAFAPADVLLLTLNA